MKVGIIISILMPLSVLSACAPALPPSPTVTSTPIPTHTFTPRPTSTVTPTPTLTPVPTTIGLTEPKIAFIGKDLQGNLGIYVDGLYTGKPQKIAPATVTEERAAWLGLRWSHDGSKLIFVNNNELNRESFYLYDSQTGEMQEITQVPRGQDVFSFNWSPDDTVFYFGAASRAHPQAMNYKIDLATRGMSQVNQGLAAAHNSHAHTQTDCNWESQPQTIRGLSMGGVGGLGPNGVIYDRICFYPELNAYAGLKYNEETTDFVLLTEAGEEDRVLATFPANFGLNGFMDLSLSPDASQLLVIGEGSVEAFGNGCCQFAHLVQLSGPPADQSDKEIFAGWPHFVHVFGWSPDGRNYLIAERDWNAASPEDKIEIVQADSGDVVYEYRIPSQVSPVFSIQQVITGYDMIWPAAP